MEGPAFFDPPPLPPSLWRSGKVDGDALVARSTLHAHSIDVTIAGTALSASLDLEVIAEAGP